MTKVNFNLHPKKLLWECKKEGIFTYHIDRDGNRTKGIRAEQEVLRAFETELGVVCADTGETNSFPVVALDGAILDKKVTRWNTTSEDFALWKGGAIDIYWNEFRTGDYIFSRNNYSTRVIDQKKKETIIDGMGGYLKPIDEEKIYYETIDALHEFVDTRLTNKEYGLLQRKGLTVAEALLLIVSRRKGWDEHFVYGHSCYNKRKIALRNSRFKAVSYILQTFGDSLYLSRIKQKKINDKWILYQKYLLTQK